MLANSSDGTATHTRTTFVPEYGFTTTEHDPNRPWMVISIEHRIIKLPDGVSFSGWPAPRWPASRRSVELGPWRLAPQRGRSERLE
jgi:hypothetical protein